MVCTGARRFHDLKFFLEAANKVRQLAGPGLLQVQDPIPTIQAVLILCLWPLPVDASWKDSTHGMAGAAMQLAVQNGLHKFGNEQDFRTTAVYQGNENTRVFRMHVWLYCIILFQRYVKHDTHCNVPY